MDGPSKTIKNIVQNYIPHETITCVDRDPPWINKDIKELIHEKNHLQVISSKKKKKTHSLFISSNFFNQS